MRNSLKAFALLLCAGAVHADNITDSDKLLCSASEVAACVEGAECVTTMPWEMNVPQFVVIDLKKKTISTTKASGENRSTPIKTLLRDDVAIHLQGIEANRAFSFTIEKLSGILTVAVSVDGLTLSVFGACTDADI
ncbi:MAG TPA: hypothetical protein PKK10_04295 [Woeseiaceae bacterium]|nr:hypothetical protein [Woeseiaceae bacterium]